MALTPIFLINKGRPVAHPLTPLWPLLNSRAMPAHLRSASLLASLAALSLASVARADWPMARHDPQRTGATSGTSNITKPTPYFKTYLGGEIDPLSLVTHDVDGDGHDEVIYVTGGRVVAKRPNDSVVWETPPLDAGGFLGLGDLDGDGKADLSSLRAIASTCSRSSMVRSSGPTPRANWARSAEPAWATSPATAGPTSSSRSAAAAG